MSALYEMKIHECQRELAGDRGKSPVFNRSTKWAHQETSSLILLGPNGPTNIPPDFRLPGLYDMNYNLQRRFFLLYFFIK